jgi:hypothetical protein
MTRQDESQEPISFKALNYPGSRIESGMTTKTNARREQFSSAQGDEGCFGPASGRAKNIGAILLILSNKKLKKFYEPTRCRRMNFRRTSSALKNVPVCST